MKFSIITASYNSASTIESCMRSVLDQSHSNIEYILMDGGSTDETLEVINSVSKQYPKVNIQLTSEPDHGIYDALNKGIAKATGDIIGIVHSDDLLAQNTTLEHIAKAFQLKRVDGVYGDLLYVQSNNPSKVIRTWTSQLFRPVLLKKGWMPAHPTLYLKREVYQQSGMFNTHFKIAADYDFILRIFKNAAYSWQYLPEVIVKMRLGGASNKSISNILQKSKEDYKAIKTNKISRFPFLVLLSKNLSKIPQFFSRYKESFFISNT